MRVGTLCYATDQGLGILAKQFYDNGVVTDVLVVQHSSRKTHLEWYPGAPVTSSRRIDRKLAEELIQRVDVMLFFETPFDWTLIDVCRRYGVRSVLMPMHECTPAKLPDRPDLFLNPSLLEQEAFGGVHLPVPVTAMPRVREQALTFVHNAGHGGLMARNGTPELIDAMKLVSSPAKLVLRTQEPLRYGITPNVEVRVGTVPYSQLFVEGDVFVFPEKFNGLSLPLQEAFASGMPVVATRRFPMDTWLLHEFLVDPVAVRRMRISSAYREFDGAVVTPAAIAAKIDQWYGKDIREASEYGIAWGAANSWSVLKPKYLEVLCGSRT